MSNNSDSHEVQKQVRSHLRIFVALIVFTLVNFIVSYFMHVDSQTASVVIALGIALVEAFLVAGFMMHLTTERKIVHIVLVFTVFFFTAMMYLILWANRGDNRLGHGVHV